jgi:predicted tellurium resistance membrane protein TerC
VENTLSLLASPEAWAAFVTLSVMEIVLGIDNIIFISILVGKLPEPAATRARQIGLLLAFVFRVLLLFGITWVIGLTAAVFTLPFEFEMADGHQLFDPEISWRDLILAAGGLFLLVKATREIHQEIEHEEKALGRAVAASFAGIIVQVVLIDMVFSVDSILTAVGMADDVEVMVAAVLVAILIMYVASGPIADFVKRNPTTKMLALAFLLLIGVALIADGLGFHIPRAYIYFAMAFAALVEVFNVLARRGKRKTS